MYWINHSNENPDITLSDWFKAFGVLAGIAMNLADIKEEVVDKAIDKLSGIAKNSYLESKDQIKPSTLQ